MHSDIGKSYSRLGLRRTASVLNHTFASPISIFSLLFEVSSILISSFRDLFRLPLSSDVSGQFTELSSILHVLSSAILFKSKSLRIVEYLNLGTCKLQTLHRNKEIQRGIQRRRKSLSKTKENCVKTPGIYDKQPMMSPQYVKCSQRI